MESKGQLHIQVNPQSDPGVVTVKVYCRSDGTNIGAFSCQKGAPLDQVLDLLPGRYAVTISWQDGWQNIASGGGEGNMITATMTNGEKEGLYYQVMGSGSTLGTFGVEIR